MQLKDMPRARVLIRLVLLFAALLCLSSCALSAQDPEAGDKPRPQTTQAAATSTPQEGDAMSGNLMAWANSRAEAEKIAEQYNISLIAYSDYIAVFYTDQDLDALIKLGKANGWPELSKNSIITIDDP